MTGRSFSGRSFASRPDATRSDAISPTANASGTAASRLGIEVAASDLPRRDRSIGIDLLRIVTVASIVLTHNWQEEWAPAWFSTWHTVIFFVLTGYLWNDHRPIGADTRRRARALVVPYLFWLLIVTVIFQTALLAADGAIDPDWLLRAAAGGSYAGRPYSPFWFITTLFFAAVLMRVLQRISPPLVWIAGGLGVLWCLVSPSTITAIPAGLGLALPAVAFIGAGRLLRTHRASIGRPLVVGAAVAVPLLIAGGFGVVAPLDLKYADLGDPLVSMVAGALISCGLILVAEWTDGVLPRWSAPMITAWAAVALPIILTHTLVLWFTERAGMEPTKWTFLLAYLLPLAVGLLVSRTRLRPYLM
ncbi:acyltransferase family protein [Agromyces allii]|nr:acyltransferase family protein [Agromyces allii]